MSVLRLGTRASALATTQSGWVAARLREAGHEVELVPVSTEGDRSSRPLVEIGGTGVFASALRQALQQRHIDLAVHSLKDLPVAPEPGLVLAAVPEREDPRDAVVSRPGLTLAQAPNGTRVGTGSPRRAAQLRALNPGLDVTDLRGNVDTRISRVASGELDAVVLAVAGLSRLGRLEEATELLDLTVMLPAPGQGALAVECRADATAVRDAVAVLEHEDTRRAVTAERAVLARLEAGCTAPVAALARREGRGLSLSAVVGTHSGLLRAQGSGPDPDDLGRQLADRLLAGLDGPDPRPRHPGTDPGRPLHPAPPAPPPRHPATPDPTAADTPAHPQLSNGA